MKPRPIFYESLGIPLKPFKTLSVFKDLTKIKTLEKKNKNQDKTSSAGEGKPEDLNQKK
jgi:hypothetical protein